MFDRAGTIVQEDNAPSHAFKHQHKVFMDWNVARLIWCANSPDLNAIEPCWIWLKRKTTRHGPCRIKKDAEEKWTKAWSHLSQKRIKRWIERIPRHVQEVIALDGGNEYREGCTDGNVRPYDKEDRRRRYLTACRMLQNDEQDDEWKTDDEVDEVDEVDGD